MSRPETTPFDADALEPHIRGILGSPGTDLATISAKRVRKQLSDTASLTPEFLKENRVALDELISRVFAAVTNDQGSTDLGETDTKHRKRKSKEDNDRHPRPKEGKKHADHDDDLEDDEVVSPSTKKAKKMAKSGRGATELSDAELARRLSSEINSRASRRNTGQPSLNGSSTSTRKNAKKKKSAATVLSDGSEAEKDLDRGKSSSRKSGGTAKGGFAKEYNLSEPLAAVLDADKLSRPQVVKRLWEYIKGHGLQNPKNGREIMCDDNLRAVFNTEKVDMFRMNKVLGQHLHESD